MEIGYLSILALGFVLGIKHAIEPDHVIAVSTIASRSKKLWRSSLSGVFWGIGHTITLFIFGIFIILMKGEISTVWAMSLEFLVGIMLVYLGITSIRSIKKMEGNLHEKHPKDEITYMKSSLIGFVHGLAGSAAMVLLTMSTVESVWEGAIYILIFGVGTIVGMLFFTTLLGIPFILSSKKVNLNKTFILITGGISTIFGIYYMYNLGVTDGLFKLWIQ
ncbi:urease accessory protein UreH [Metabacillus litoralis]|uniref:Urease accessory protein UreH n=1 Tax=Metabacillus litoralis TaxID=152268 RepID=A0A5C6W7B5_9BACI|nr:sulfite exporter TauE/SafE family protein [Metabacillus litoralis]TXC92825.1 urease accessory protein UreH [Metabacillus litoralis]